MTRQEALDQAAKHHDKIYESFQEAIADCYAGNGSLILLQLIINSSLDIMWNAAIDAAAALSEPSEHKEDGFSPIEKQSILKLKKP